MNKILTVVTITVLANFSTPTQSSGDAALRQISEKDRIERTSAGSITDISSAEHLQRADLYSANRLFPQAREHWQKVLDNYPNDPGVPKALFGIGRSYMWERQYDKAVFYFDKVSKDFPDTKDGREGLAFKGACYVRLGKHLDAAKTYEQYTIIYPAGERLESSFLNIIDALREAGKYDDANRWIDNARLRFAGKPTEVNALHARLRMEIYRQKWSQAIGTADALMGLKSFAGSMTATDEVKYLKAFSLDKSGRKAEASMLYSSIPATATSYFGGLAFEKLNPAGSIKRTISATPALFSDYPVLYRDEVLRQARSRKIDPRFVLAIMKQESVFKANAKSPAGARGLLQLVFDTALKYNTKAGYPAFNPDDLYTPAVNIAIGSVYIGELKDEFGGLYEAIAASYNGGEDNAARWLNRSKPNDPGIFVSEIGFAESKNYVFKVMNNYRIYRDLYTEELQRR